MENVLRLQLTKLNTRKFATASDWYPQKNCIAFSFCHALRIALQLRSKFETKRHKNKLTLVYWKENTN